SRSVFSGGRSGDEFQRGGNSSFTAEARRRGENQDQVVVSKRDGIDFQAERAGSYRLLARSCFLCTPLIISESRLNHWRKRVNFTSSSGLRSWVKKPCRTRR